MKYLHIDCVQNKPFSISRLIFFGCSPEMQVVISLIIAQNELFSGNDLQLELIIYLHTELERHNWRIDMKSILGTHSNQKSI